MERLHIWKFDVNGSVANACNTSSGKFLNNLLSFAAITKKNEERMLSITQAANRWTNTEHETNLIKYGIKVNFFFCGITLW